MQLGKCMNIEELNRKHFLETDMFYRVGYGLSSKLLDFKNGVIYLEIVTGRKWKKSHNATAHELAHCWKKTHPELSHAIACKVYIIDTKKNPYKRSLLNVGVQADYDARKGVIFAENFLN